jgi:hypothetical protein
MTSATPTPAPTRSTGRSIWAIVAGFILVVVLSLGTDAVMHATGIFPPWGKPMSESLFGLAFAYRSIYGIAGSYLTARLAPQRPMKHALIGGAIGTVIAIVGAAATWNKGPEFGPYWYPLALVVTGLPYAWLGGKMYSPSR